MYGMKPCVLLFAVLSLPVFSQTVIGTVEKIDKEQLQMKSRDGLVTLKVDEKTTVTKAKKFNDLSPLAVGDEVRVNYYGEGTLTAVNISAKITLSGVITEARSNSIAVLLNSPATATSPDRSVVMFVFLNSTVKFAASRNQLTIGRRVQVEGWDTGDRVVEADKVAISETDPPLRPTPQRPPR